MKTKLLRFIILGLCIVSCSSVKKKESDVPITASEKTYSYGYYPIEPLPICKPSFKKDEWNSKVLEYLPDETMRMAIGEVKKSGGISFSGNSIGVEGSDYVVILDYMKFTTRSFPFNTKNKVIVENYDTDDTQNIPVYIGVGLRLTANIHVKKGNINLGNLFGIGANATAEKVSGTLIVQSLGISGAKITASIPMPSEINPTTIQNAIMALGTIKAQIYDNETNLIPRIVGLYDNIGGGTVAVNQFISQVLNESIDIEKINDKCVIYKEE